MRSPLGRLFFAFLLLCHIWSGSQLAAMVAAKNTKKPASASTSSGGGEKAGATAAAAAAKEEKKGGVQSVEQEDLSGIPTVLKYGILGLICLLGM